MKSSKQKIKQHIESLKKQKEGKPTNIRLELAREIDYWNDVLNDLKPDNEYFYFIS
jgi:tyrosine-protein phosphatase YwqE